MPEVPVKEVRLSDLHLPEIKRDEIIRTLSEIHVPEIDLSKVELPEGVSKAGRAGFERSSRSIGKGIAALLVAARLRPAPRSARWPLAVGGLIVAGVAAAAILSNATVRARLSEGASAVRQRVAAMRPSDERLEIEPDEVVAFDAAETAQIEEPPFGDASAMDATEYPAGLGAPEDTQVNGHDSPVGQAGSRD